MKPSPSYMSVSFCRCSSQCGQAYLSQPIFVIVIFLLARIVDAICAICLLRPGFNGVASLAIKVLVLLLVAAYVGDCVEELRHGDSNKDNAWTDGSGEGARWAISASSLRQRGYRTAAIQREGDSGAMEVKERRRAEVASQRFAHPSAALTFGRTDARHVTA